MLLENVGCVRCGSVAGRFLFWDTFGQFCVVPLLLQIFLAKADSAAKGSEAVGILLPHPFPIVTLL